MAELRSFIIGVTIAAAVLGIAALAFGAFGGDGDGAPSVVLLGTPPATRTPQPAPTRSATSTPPPPSANQTAPAGNATAASTPEAPEATATATPAQEPTQAPTATPAGASVADYVATANPLTQGIAGQLAYLIGNAQSPAVGDANWRTFTLQAAQNVHGYAASISALAVPDCLTSAHGTLASGANQASAAASELIAAVQANDAAAVGAAAASLSAANGAVGEGVAALNASAC